MNPGMCRVIALTLKPKDLVLAVSATAVVSQDTLRACAPWAAVPRHRVVALALVTTAVASATSRASVRRHLARQHPLAPNATIAATWATCRETAPVLRNIRATLVAPRTTSLPNVLRLQCEAKRRYRVIVLSIYTAPKGHSAERCDCIHLFPVLRPRT